MYNNVLHTKYNFSILQTWFSDLQNSWTGTSPNLFCTTHSKSDKPIRNDDITTKYFCHHDVIDSVASTKIAAFYRGQDTSGHNISPVSHLIRKVWSSDYSGPAHHNLKTLNQQWTFSHTTIQAQPEVSPMRVLVANSSSWHFCCLFYLPCYTIALTGFTIL